MEALLRACLYNKQEFFKLLNYDLYNEYYVSINSCLIYNATLDLDFALSLYEFDFVFHERLYKPLYSILLANNIYRDDFCRLRLDSIWIGNVPSVDFCKFLLTKIHMFKKNKNFNYLIAFVAVLRQDSELYKLCNIRLFSPNIYHYACRFELEEIVNHQLKFINNERAVNVLWLFDENDGIAYTDSSNFEYRKLVESDFIGLWDYPEYGYEQERSSDTYEDESYFTLYCFDLYNNNLVNNNKLIINCDNSIHNFSLISLRNYHLCNIYRSKLLCVDIESLCNASDDFFFRPVLPYIYRYDINRINNNLKYSLLFNFLLEGSVDRDYDDFLPEYNLLIFSSKFGNKFLYDKIIKKANEHGCLYKILDIDNNKYIDPPEKVSLNRIVPYKFDIDEYLKYYYCRDLM